MSGSTKSARLNFILEVAVLTIFCLLCAYQIFGPVPIGLANNGDFAKVLGLFHVLEPPPEFRYFVPDLKIDPDKYYNAGLPASEILVAAVARLICKLLVPRYHFDLRVMGAIHLSVMLVAMALMLRAFRRFRLPSRLLCTGLLVFVWSDVEYVQFFNTAYIDAGAMVFYCLFVAVALNVVSDTNARHAGWMLLFTVSGLLFLTSKLQHVLLAVLLVPLTVLIAWRSENRTLKRVWLVAPVLFLVAAYLMARASDPLYRADPAWSLVFYRLAPGSRSPDLVLREFNINPAMKKFVGTFAYSPEVHIGDRAVRQYAVQTITMKRVVMYYLNHPDEGIRYLRSDWITFAPDVNLEDWAGRFRKIDVDRGRTNKYFTWWSSARRLYGERLPWLIPALLVLNLLFCGCCAASAELRSKRPEWPILALLLLSATITFAVASLNDVLETARHITLSQFSIDLILLLDVMIMMETANSWHKERGAEPETRALCAQKRRPPGKIQAGANEQES